MRVSMIILLLFLQKQSLAPGSLLSGTRLSYGASVVVRTSDRGRVVEVKPFFIEVCGALNPGFPFSPL